MPHSFIPFSILLSGENPPVELMNPFNFGLAPLGVVVVVLLVIAGIWVAMSVQAGRADLHDAGHHDAGHHDAGH